MMLLKLFMVYEDTNLDIRPNWIIGDKKKGCSNKKKPIGHFVTPPQSLDGPESWI